ncbi:MAG: MBL fold metallo-hydrolase [Pygmaiobacter massiliensis]|nr:MBL fold metallo-hydrolase [Pygmaiobacter massiliensis]
MKVTTLIENENADHPQLFCEHGLSMLVETGGFSILFDTGATGHFMDNAKKLGIDLSHLNAVVVSHGHFDHAGGLVRLLQELDDSVPVYVGDGFLEEKYKKTPQGYRYLGVPPLKNPQRLHQLEKTTKLKDGIWIVKNFTKTNEFEKPNPLFVKKQKDGWQLDLFSDEIALAVRCRQGLVVIAGCSHIGIVNLLRSVQAQLAMPIFGVIGGSHLVEADTARLSATLDAFKQMGIQRCWLSHCTGLPAMEFLEQQFAGSFFKNHTGNQIEILE